MQAFMYSVGLLQHSKRRESVIVCTLGIYKLTVYWCMNVCLGHVSSRFTFSQSLEWTEARIWGN